MAFVAGALKQGHSTKGILNGSLIKNHINIAVQLASLTLLPLCAVAMARSFGTGVETTRRWMESINYTVYKK